jgi:hypothetical protein
MKNKFDIKDKILIFLLLSWIYKNYKSYNICQKAYQQEIGARLIEQIDCNYCNKLNRQFKAIAGKDTFIYKSEYYMQVDLEHRPTAYGDSIYKSSNSFTTYIYKKDTCIVVEKEACNCSFFYLKTDTDEYRE